MSDPGSIFYEVSGQRLAEQVKQIDTLDGKTDKMLTWSAGTLGLLGASIGLVGKAISGWSVALFAEGFAIYVVVVVSALAAYQKRQYSYRPDADMLQRYSESLDQDRLRFWVARERVASIAHSQSQIGTKTTHLSRA